MEYYSASNRALGTSQLNVKQAMLFPRENITTATLLELYCTYKPKRDVKFNH